MIDVKQLQCFVTLAEVGHFGRAAHHLNTTQPPLSRKLAALEAALGVRLLNRSAHCVTLTDAGLHFYQDAKSILGSVQHAERTVKSVSAADGGRLTLGFSAWASHARLLSVLNTFTHRFPHVYLTIDELSPHSLLDDLASGKTDAAIEIAGTSATGLEKRTLWQEALTLVVAARHPLARCNVMRMRELDSLPAIVCSGPMSELAGSLGHKFSRPGRATSVCIEAERPDTLLNLVADNTGAALVPASFRYRITHAEVAFVEIQDSPCVDFQVAWSADNVNPCLRGLLQVLETVGRD